VDRLLLEQSIRALRHVPCPHGDAKHFPSQNSGSATKSRGAERKISDNKTERCIFPRAIWICRMKSHAFIINARIYLCARGRTSFSLAFRCTLYCIGCVRVCECTCDNSRNRSNIKFYLDAHFDVAIKFWKWGGALCFHYYYVLRYLVLLRRSVRWFMSHLIGRLLSLRVFRLTLSARVSRKSLMLSSRTSNLFALLVPYII
jgi:hypothetical protein